MKPASILANRGALGGPICLLIFFLLALPQAVRAQWVADGQTNVLNGVIATASSSVSVGTNAGFTKLIITNGATATVSSGVLFVGNNTSSQTNRLVVTGAGSSLNAPVIVGQYGSANELDILNGALVSGTCTVGSQPSGSNNLVWISGPGSVWTNAQNLNLGNPSPNNRLVLTNGGTIWANGIANVGYNSGGSGNSVLITGGGSQWSSGGYFNLGYTSPGWNQLAVNNGGTFICSNTCDIGAYGNSNLLTVADSGSAFYCKSFRLGYASTGNQCVVSHGATLSASNAVSQATTVEGTFTTAVVTGSGSVWTNNVDFSFGQYSNQLLVVDGGVLADYDCNISVANSSPPKTNLITVAGAGSLWTNRGDLHIADAGLQLLITNGGTLGNGYGYLGDSSSSHDCFALVAGAGSSWSNRSDLYLGNTGGTNLLVVTDSGAVWAKALYVGYSSDQNQLVVSNNGVVSVQNLQIGKSQATNNAVVVANGTLKVASTLQATGPLIFNSGLITAGDLIASTGYGGSYLIFRGGKMSLGMFYYTVSDSSLMTVGDGTNAAIMEWTGSSSHYVPAGLYIANNALLTGGGSVSGNVFIANGASFAPGATNLASLTLNNGLFLAGGSTTIMAVEASSGASSQVLGPTNLTYGGTLQLVNLDGAYQAGQSYQLFSATQFSGTFTNLIPATPGAGLRWDTYELGVDGTLRVLSATTTPPVIGSVGASGGNLTLGATGGVAYDPCYLLTTTNLASPVWTGVATNYYDATGATTFTNALPSGEPQRYFRLGGN
jgi:T5SS/PEP-CTERM-associated repeat protein